MGGDLVTGEHDVVVPDFDFGDPPLSRMPATPTSSRDTCAVCREPMTGDEVHLLLDQDTHVHPKHFDVDPADVPAEYIGECWYCGLRIMTESRPLRYCSRECARDAANDARRIMHGAVTCSECGEAFRPARSDAVTCSPRCRQRRRRRVTPNRESTPSRDAAPGTGSGRHA